MSNWISGPDLDPAGDLWSSIEAALNSKPEATAIMDPASGESVDRARLLASVERAAGRLWASGARPGDRVLIDLEVSIDEVIFILACVRQGLVYVGLDRRQETSSFELVVSDCQPTLVVTTRPPEWTSVPALEPVGSPAARVEPSGQSDSAPCYISYTSGTTGRPKGVQIPRSGVDRLMRGATYVRLQEEQRFLRFAPLAFDASTLEVFVPIWAGATLVIGPRGPLELTVLANFIEVNRVEVLWLTSGIFSALVENFRGAFRSVDRVLTGGDRVSASAVTSLLASQPGITVVNGYGPTEATTFATVKVMDADHPPFGSVPIGTPISDTSVLVDEDGELLIAGRGLAIGYWNDPESTLAKFPTRFGRRVYRTGDLAKLENGELHFEGRVDRQAKIRGHRVEPAAVDEVLRSARAVAESWTLSDRDHDNPTLTCAYVPPDGSNVSERDLRELLTRSALPSYSVPHRFVALERLPLTKNGKVDEAQLLKAISEQKPVHSVLANPVRSSEQEADSIRATVRSAWSEVLSDAPFDDDEAFFDVGGDSLRLARLHSVLEARFPSAGLKLVDLFRLPTVETQAMRLEQG